MWNDEENIEGLTTEIRKSIDAIFSDFHDSLFDVRQRSLRPLYRIETAKDTLRVLIDLPFVAKKEDLNLTATDQSLSIEAKTHKPVSLVVGGAYQKRIEFEKYSATIRFPVKVNPSGAKARLRNGILVVEFSVHSPSHPIKIQ